MASSDSEDDRMQRVPRGATVSAQQVPKKTNVVRNTVQEKRIQCSRLIRSKRFIIITSALVFLIILAIVLGVTLGKSKSTEEYDQRELIPLKWWQNSTIYRVYVTSFADSDGDGRGDFKGLQEKLTYLKELGVDVLWLSPIQNTNTVSGTDVTDFKLVKTQYGGLQDFRDLLVAAQSMGMKVIMDIILNHSGSAHKWFQQSKAGTAPFKDYYIWSKGKSTGVPNAIPLPPNNWVSIYGGSAWQWNDYRQEYFLRQFWKNEPDLNYRSSQIISEMNSAVNFWSDVGVDGFYLRDPSFLYEEAQLSDEPQLNNSQDYASLSHNYTRDLPESYQAILSIFGGIQPKINRERVVLMEVNERVMSDERWAQTFQMMTTSALYKLNPVFTGLELRTAIQSSLESFNKTKVWPTWVLGNEEKSRISSKFNQLAFGLQMMQIFLPGSTSIYYGEEIQLTNTASISYDETIDSVARDAGRSNYTLVSRDPFHTPMKWNSSRNAGFTSATTPWLPINNADPTVDSQKNPPNSVWNTMREMIEIKKSSIVLTNGTIDYPVVENDIFSFTRTHPLNSTGFLIVWNVGNQRKTVSFADTSYISNEITTIRKIRPDGGRTETSTIRKIEVNVESKELIIFSFWKQY